MMRSVSAGRLSLFDGFSLRENVNSFSWRTRQRESVNELNRFLLRFSSVYIETEDLFRFCFFFLYLIWSAK